MKEHEDTHEREVKRHRLALLRLDLQRMADYSIQLDIYAIASDIDRDPPRPPITLNKDLEKLAHPTLNTVLKSVNAVRIFIGRYPPGTETSDELRKAQGELGSLVADSLKATEDLRRAIQGELLRLGA